MDWLKWIEYMSPIRYSFEFFLRTEFDGTSLLPNPADTLSFFFQRWHIMLIEIGYILFYIAIGLITLKLTTRAIKN
jgi:hypothetical protein